MIYLSANIFPLLNLLSSPTGLIFPRLKIQWVFDNGSIAHFKDPNGTVGRITQELNQIFALESLTTRLRIESMPTVKFIKNLSLEVQAPPVTDNLYTFMSIVNQSTWQEADVYALLSYGSDTDGAPGVAWGPSICDTRRTNRTLMAEYKFDVRTTAEVSHEKNHIDLQVNV